jgi:hypothetical protein
MLAFNRRPDQRIVEFVKYRQQVHGADGFGGNLNSRGHGITAEFQIETNFRHTRL